LRQTQTVWYNGSVGAIGQYMNHDNPQGNFFSEEKRLQKILEGNKHLVAMKEEIDWDMFRPLLVKIVCGNRSNDPRGRCAYDVVFMFKVLVLGKLYGNLPPEKLEYAIYERASFRYFLGISSSGSIPDERTIRAFRDSLKGRFKELFLLFRGKLQKEGYLLEEGKIVDATLIHVPIQRNSREENKEIKEGMIPEEWSEKKKAHKDTDAKWKKKNNEKHFGYEDHVIGGEKSKLIDDYTSTSAEVHDSQELPNLIEDCEKGIDLWGDSAYRSEKIENLLSEKQITSQIHEKGYKNKPLTEEQKKQNREKSKVRARVEHIFASIEQTSGTFIRTIGKFRATIEIGLINLVYNIKRYIHLSKKLLSEA